MTQTLRCLLLLAWFVLASSCVSAPKTTSPMLATPAPTPTTAPIDSGQVDFFAFYTARIQADPEDWKAYRERGRAYYAFGQLDLALADFTNFVKYSPKDPEAYMDRGNAYAVARLYSEALADYDRSIALADSREAHAARALAQFNLGRLSEGSSDCEKALQLASGPTYEASLLICGAIHAFSKDFPRAIKEFEEYSRLHGALGHDVTPLILLAQGYAFVNTGKRDQARAMARRIVEEDGLAESRFSGMHLMEIFDLEKRRSERNAAKASAAGAEETMNWSKAFSDYELALGTGPEITADDRASLADIRDGLKRVYPRLQTKPVLPEYARRYLVRARTLIKGQDTPGNMGYRQALIAYDALLLATPWCADAYYNAALLRAQLKEYTIAIADMKAYLALAPDAKDARLSQNKIYEWEALLK